MSEHGFYHTNIGYWQTIDDVPDDVMETYPEGTVEVPLRPSRHHEWDGSAWVSVPSGNDEPDQITIESLTFAQLLIGLVERKWITEADGDGWLQGVLPPSVTAVIAQLPQDQRFAARARASRPSVILRSDPLVIALAASQGKSPDQLDTFFTIYSQA